MSDGLKRILVAAVGIPLFVLCILAGSYLLWLLIIALEIAALIEWSRLARASRRDPPSFLWTVLLALSVNIVFYSGFHSVALASLLILVTVVLCLITFRTQRNPLDTTATAVLFVTYVSVPLSLWTIVNSFGASVRFGELNLLLLLVAATWVCDSAAYYGGRAFGKTPLFPAASPKKTIEGAISGFLASAAVLPVISIFSDMQLTRIDFLAIPFCVGIAGQIGDLLESRMKRQANMKDTSALLPGHGGVLDRFDSLLVSTPAFVGYLMLTSP